VKVMQKYLSEPLCQGETVFSFCEELGFGVDLDSFPSIFCFLLN